MALTAGRRIGPYEIQSALGAGGMGEVYRARDTRLDRMVAIKVLSPNITTDPAFLERFDREARTISQLNHPHICTLHDVGQQDGAPYLVLEYLKGETLAARLAKGPLPIQQAVTIGIQICDALDKAHRQGIVHRDLKPGNVMLVGKSGSDPHAKLLDFGLAKSANPGLAATGGHTRRGVDGDQSADRARNAARNAAVYGARTDRRPRRRCAVGHLCVGSGAPRDGIGAAHVRWEESRERYCCDSGAQSAGALDTADPDAACARSHRGAMPGQGSG